MFAALRSVLQCFVRNYVLVLLFVDLLDFMFIIFILQKIEKYLLCLKKLKNQPKWVLQLCLMHHFGLHL